MEILSQSKLKFEEDSKEYEVVDTEGIKGQEDMQMVKNEDRNKKVTAAISTGAAVVAVLFEIFRVVMSNQKNN